MECEMMPHARKNSAKLTLSLLQVVLIPAAKGGIRVKIDKEGRVKGRTVPNRDELEVGGSQETAQPVVQLFDSLIALQCFVWNSRRMGSLSGRLITWSIQG